MVLVRLLLLLLFYFICSNASGYQFISTQEVLEKKLQKQFREGKTTVELSELDFDGLHLVNLVRKYPAVNIFIKNCIIRKGLHFHSSSSQNLDVIKNNLEIVDSEVQASPIQQPDSRTLGKFSLYSSNIDFSGSHKFIRVKFHGNVRFNNSTFTEKQEFRNIQISGKTNFFKTIHNNILSFRETHFQEHVRITEAVFSSIVSFDDIRADNLFLISDNRVEFYLKISGSAFNSIFRIRNCEINSFFLGDRETPTVFSKPFELQNSDVRLARLRDVTFQGKADFTDTVFGTNKSKESGIQFLSVLFNRDVDFIRTVFAGKSVFYQTRVKENADFTNAAFDFDDAKSQKSLVLSYFNLNKARLNWSQLPPIQHWTTKKPVISKSGIAQTKAKGQTQSDENQQSLSSVLRSFEILFKRQQQPKDANQAHHNMKLAILQESQTNGWDFDRFLAEIEGKTWGLISDYGTNLGSTLAWCLGICALFAFAYLGIAEFSDTESKAINKDVSIKARLTDLPSLYLLTKEEEVKYSNNRYTKAFWLSFVLLLKIGSRHAIAAPKTANLERLLKTIIRLEWAIGYALLFILLMTLANTQPLLNKLFAGIF